MDDEPSDERPMTPLRCKEFVDFLMAYLDRELSEDVRREFERHLADCPPCHVYLDTYRRTVELGRSVCREAEASVPEEVPDELMEAILAARRRPGGEGA